MTAWHRFGRAMLGEESTPIEALLRDRGVDTAPLADSRRRWTELSSAVLGMLFAPVEALEGERRERAAALAVFFVYSEALVFWEYCSEHERLNGLLEALCSTSSALGGGAPGPALVWAATPPPATQRVGAGLRDLFLAVSAAAAAVSRQLEVENAWMCGCPVSMLAASQAACDAIEAARAALGRVVLPPADAGPVLRAGLGAADPLDGVVLGIVSALAESLDDASAYFGLLRDEVAPAGLAFAGNLYDRSDDRRVAERLRRAIAEVDVVEASRIRGVLRSEARAQRRSLAGMLEIVAEGTPSLFVDRGAVHFIYPFGLPLSETGNDVIRDAIATYLAGDDSSVPQTVELAGCAVALEETLQTEGLAQSLGLFDPRSSGPDAVSPSSGARLTFTEDQLELRTASGIRHRGLDVSITLGALGNHVLQVSVSTGTPSVWPEELLEGSPAPPHGWTPHDLDLMMRRGGLEFGDESVALVPGPEDDSGREPTEFTSLIEFAATVVEDLHLEAGRLADRLGVAIDDPARPLSYDVDRRIQTMRQQAHVVALLTEVEVVGRDGRRRAQGPEQLHSAAGSIVLRSPLPPSPRVLEEWACLPDDADRVADREGVLGSMGSQILCNGDNTLVFAPASPNWQLLEDVDLMRFGLSLGSAYALARQRLLACADDARQRLDDEDGVGPDQREQIEGFAAQVRTTEAQLVRLLGLADSLLEHAHGAVVVRPRRDRAILDYVQGASGITDLQESLAGSKSVASDRLADLRDASLRIAEALRRSGQEAVERLLLVVAVLAFIDLFWWSSDIFTNYGSGSRGVWFIEVLALLLLGVAVAIRVFGRRGPPSRGGLGRWWRRQLDRRRQSGSSSASAEMSAIGTAGAAQRDSRARNVGSPSGSTGSSHDE